MSCPYLEYRESDDGREFGTERAFCTVTGSFVQPMRADICNDRYGLHHAKHCEIYLEHEAEDGLEAEQSTGDDRATGEEP